MYLNIKNLDNENKYITTDDVEFKLSNGNIIESKLLYKRPILLVILR
jgi:hypothetical protein